MLYIGNRYYNMYIYTTKVSIPQNVCLSYYNMLYVSNPILSMSYINVVRLFVIMMSVCFNTITASGCGCLSYIGCRKDTSTL